MKRANGPSIQFEPFDNAKGGRNALILGPVGSGKTKLLQELVAAIDTRGTPKTRTHEPKPGSAQ